MATVNDAARNAGVFIHLFCCCQPLKSFINYSFTNQASAKIIPQIFVPYLPSLLSKNSNDNSETPGDSEGQGSLVSCTHGIAKNQIQLNNNNSDSPL